MSPTKPKSPTMRTVMLPVSGRSILYELERKSVKNFNLRVRLDGTVHLSVPRRITIAEVDRFLIEREDWLMAAFEQVAARAKAHPTASGHIGDSLPYLGDTLTVSWVQGSPAAIEADPEHRHLTVRLPAPDDSAMRMAAVEVFEHDETKRLVTALVSHYHPFFAERGVAYPKHIRVKSLKSRHGSCAPQTGSLNFAAKLCEYPLPFIEYVVVHELCHFLVPNHSEAFWREVERLLPDRKEREKLGKM